MSLHGDHGHYHGHADEEKKPLADYIWRHETVELTTVGIDIGSSTSHLLFAKVRLQRRSQGLSSRFLVTERKILYQSPIIFTPFRPDGMIDVNLLDDFIQSAYQKAGFSHGDIDSGAVILTGEAVKRKNARNIDELFAQEAGKFVCATAGHKLESILAAHGSGAVALSSKHKQCLLHVDIGGGTTKLALIDRGQIAGVCAIAVGGRAIAKDDTGSWTRVDDSGRRVADELSLSTDPDSLADPEVRRQIARRLASVAMDFICDTPRDRLGLGLLLTEDLPGGLTPTALSFSGGVAEYLLHREKNDYGDIGAALADELQQQLTAKVHLPLLDPEQGIRATVIGASQFTVQVSGKTIYLSDKDMLPVHNIPVVQIALSPMEPVAPETVARAIREGARRMDLSPESRLAVAFTWEDQPEYSRLEALGRGIISAVDPDGRRVEPLLLMIDGDIGLTIGRILSRELGFSGGLFSVDGVQLQELDFVDIGALIEPAGVVPVVIKSLLFP